MGRVAVFVALAACGGTPKAPEVKAVATKKTAPPRMEPNCEDMGPLLRRALAPEGAYDDVQQRITSTCVSQGWSAAVMECVAQTPELKARECLEQLDAVNVQELDEQLSEYRSWEGEGDDGYVLQSCDVVMQASDVADWGPVVVDDGQRELARKLRRPALAALCDHIQLDQEVLTCIGDATDPTGLELCFPMMTIDQKEEVDRAVAAADTARVKMTALLGKPSKYSCSAVVAAHYGAVKWKGQAPTIVGGSRSKVIEASKKMMRDACNGQAWSAEVRACVVAVDAPLCWTLGALDERSWGYPAEGTVPFSTGLAECDDWGAVLTRMMTCQGIDEATRSALRGAFSSAKEAFRELSRLPKETTDAVRDSCRQARDSIAQAAQSAGC